MNTRKFIFPFFMFMTISLSGEDYINKNQGYYPQIIIEQEEYGTTGNLIYHGFAPSGSANSDALWTVKKYSYDAEDNPTSCLTSPGNSIWNNRATLTYN